MKKLLSIVLALALVLGLASCGGPKPEDTVKTFCESMKNYDEAGMKACLADQEDADSLDKDISDVSLGEDALSEKMKENALEISYKIGKSSVSGDTASVPVEFEFNDISDVMTDVMTDIFAKMFELMFSDDPNAEDEFNAYSEQVVSEKFAAAEFSKATTTVNFSMKKVGEEWKVADLDEEIVNVLTGNMLKAFEEMAEALGDEDYDLGDDWEDWGYADPVEYPISNEVLVDNDYIKLTMLGGGSDEYNNITFQMSCENKTDKDLSVSVSSVIFNKWQVDSFYYPDVPAGETVDGEMNLYISSVEKYGVTSPDELTLEIEVNDSNDWNVPTYSVDTVTVYPTGLSAAEIAYTDRPTSDNEKVILDNGDYKFVILGVNEDYYDFALSVYMENNTDEDVFFDWEDVSVNGEDIDPYWGMTVCRGARAMNAISFSYDDFEEFGIENVDEVRFTLRLLDGATLEDTVYETDADYLL